MLCCLVLFLFCFVIVLLFSTESGGVGGLGGGGGGVMVHEYVSRVSRDHSKTFLAYLDRSLEDLNQSKS